MEYWDNLFKNRNMEFLHEAELEESLNYLQGKKLLELGAGDGRNSLFLAEKNFDIAAYDYSKEGMKKLKEKAEKRNLRIKTKVIDIEKEKIEIESFEGVLFIHYFPSFDRFKEMFAKLNKNSIVFILTFIKEEVKGNKKNFGISYEEIEKIKRMGRVLKEKTFNDGRGKNCFIIVEKQ